MNRMKIIYQLIIFIFYINLCYGKKLLVLGGTGFVGSQFIQKALVLGYDIVSISRRPNKNLSSSLKWYQGDITNKQCLEKIIQENAPFDGCIHAVGLLFDSKSNLQSLNRYVSGSGSIPNNDASYDQITKQTVYDSLDLIQKYNKINKLLPFIFISAAEVSWKFNVPIDFLKRYLQAKLSVENRLQEEADTIRPIIMRPSLIWTWERPQAFVSVIPFLIANTMKIPFIDKPVNVNELIDTMLQSLQDESIQGILTYKEIQQFSKKSLTKLK